MRESDLIHYSLNLTSAMKKSYCRVSEDIFRIQDLDISLLNITNSSLERINLYYLKLILRYIKDLQTELECFYQREITYKEIRFELRKRKTFEFKTMRKEMC